jgi:hypothetical protein
MKIGEKRKSAKILLINMQFVGWDFIRAYNQGFFICKKLLPVGKIFL